MPRPTILRQRSALARQLSTFRATVLKPIDGGRQIDADLVGERGHPGQDVAELVLDLGRRTLAHRLRQLTELLGQPGDGRRHAAVVVTLARRYGR